jgi:hypothetical protein
MALCVTPDRSHNPLPVTRADKRIKCHDDGPVAEHIKLRHNHSHGEKTQWPSPYFFVWCCDNCGRQGGMTVKMNEQCPECQHYRCLNCDVEVVRTYPRDSCADSGTLTNGPLSSIYSPKLYAPGLQALMGGKRSDGHLGHSSPKILKYGQRFSTTVRYLG